MVVKLRVLTVVGGSIFVNPFTDLEAKMHAALHPEEAGGDSAKERERVASLDGEAWFNRDSVKPTAHRSGIGKYIAPQHLKSDAKADAGGSAPTSSAVGGGGSSSSAAALLAAAEMEPEPPKKKARGGGFGNFSGW